MGTGFINARNKMSVSHRKNWQGLIAVGIGTGRSQAGINRNIFELADPLDSVFHELGFGEKLSVVIKMLPLAAAAFLKNRARRSYPVGRGP